MDHNRKDISNAEFYSSATKLTMDRFITCMVEGELSSLVISGKPTNEQLSKAWLDIQQEYSDAIGDSEYTYYLNVFKETALLTIKLSSIQILVEILSNFYSEDFCIELNKLLDKKIKLNFDEKEDYYKQLQACLTRSKSLKIRIELKNIELGALQKKFSSAKRVEPTREYFQAMFTTLSDHAKYFIDEKSITVFQYCDRIRRINKQYEQNKK